MDGAAGYMHGPAGYLLSYRWMVQLDILWVAHVILTLGPWTLTWALQYNIYNILVFRKDVKKKRHKILATKSH